MEIEFTDSKLNKYVDDVLLYHSPHVIQENKIQYTTLALFLFNWIKVRFSNKSIIRN